MKKVEIILRVIWFIQGGAFLWMSWYELGVGRYDGDKYNLSLCIFCTACSALVVLLGRRRA